MTKFDITKSTHALIANAYFSTEPVLQPKHEAFEADTHEVCGHVPATVQNLYSISTQIADHLQNCLRSTADEATAARRMAQKKKVIDQLISCELLALFKKAEYSGLVLLSEWRVAGITSVDRFTAYRHSDTTQTEVV